MNTPDRFDAIMRAWANDPPIPRLAPITRRVAGLSERDLDREIAAMPTEDLEVLLAAERLANQP